ncbi:MAG: thiamine diphosphokinase [Chryseobacterium sp.]|nr:MAG: thiamine diphosphokinase [Chryseobacterium sp.]
MKALLFINGQPPAALPATEGYGLIACTDGAFHYLKRMGFPLQKLDFISGDFDSHTGVDEEIYRDAFIYTPDQNKTDFYKALELLLQRGVTHLSVYGASGGEQDHFLGNLTAAFAFREKIEIRFYDDYSTYFFIPESFTVEGVKGRTISLMPFPSADGIVTKGLAWPLNNESLEITSRIGTRNRASEDRVSIRYASGHLLVFISRDGWAEIDEHGCNS